MHAPVNFRVVFDLGFPGFEFGHRGCAWCAKRIVLFEGVSVDDEETTSGGLRQEIENVGSSPAKTKDRDGASFELGRDTVDLGARGGGVLVDERAGLCFGHGCFSLPQ